MKNLLKQYTTISLGFILLSGMDAALSTAQAATDAPTEGNMVAGFMVGQAWPAGQIGQNVSSGTVSPGLFYEYEASDVFALYAQGVYANYDSGALKTTSTNLGMKAHLVYYDKLAPFVLVGAGLYFVNEGNTPTPPITASKTLFGLHLGAGADLDISERFLIGLQFDVHTIFTGTAITSAGNVSVSGHWTGFFLRGGVRF